MSLTVDQLEPKTGIIYLATDTARDDKQYVGQTTKSLIQRKRGRYNPYFQNAIKDHGEAITWEEFGPYPVGQLDLIERCFIKGLNTLYPNGYNFNTGGNLHKVFSLSSRKKMSNSNCGTKSHMYGKHLPLKWKQSISKGLQGKNSGKANGMYQRHHSDEAKAKIGQASRNRVVTNATRLKISQAQKGLKVGLFAGERHPRAKLTWEKVTQLRQAHSDGIGCSILAKRFNLSLRHVYEIINQESWKEEYRFAHK